MPKVKNINGTAQNTCKCVSWLKHWERFAKTPASFCSEVKCTGRDLVGAHVQKAEGSDGSWYVVPLCSAHNRHKGELEIGAAYPLVSANVKDTCG